MEEFWRPIKGYEGLYEVSNFGRIKSLKYGKERILKPFNGNRNYLRVHLSKNNKPINAQIHRLVAEAFIENPKNKPFVNHIDFDQHNNKVNNLEWCTQSENCIHNIKNHKGSIQYKTILKINGETKTFNSTSEASKSLGFKRGWISTNIKRKGNPFKYKNILIEVVNYKCSIL